MSEAYKVGVAIALSSNATQIFGALGQHFLKLDKHLTNFQNNWKKTALLIGGGLGALGTVTILKNAEKLIDHGNHLIKIQRDMAQAGATNVQVQEAYSKAWELTGKYQNIGAADMLKSMNDARAIFGNQDTATREIEPLIRIGSFLRAYQGSEKGTSTHDSIMREIQAAMKSGEISGNITPEEMRKHADNLAAMKVYYGDQVSIARYLQAQRAAGVSYLTTGDEFRYGMFPALVQEFGPGAGVMQQTLWAKTVAGVMNRTSSLQAMDQYGLLKEGEVKYDKVGRAIGLKHGGESIVGSDVAAVSYPKWVMETVIPNVLKKRGITADADGHYSKKDLVTIASVIGQFFPDRNAMKAVMEAFVQYPKLLKDAAGLLKVHKDWETYTAGSWDYQKQAFTTQWNSFLDAVGAPLVATATERLAKLNTVMSGFSQWAAKPENADTIRGIADAIGYLAVGLGVGSAVAIMAAIGPAGWLIGGLAALGTVLATDGMGKDAIDRWLSGLRNLPAEIDKLFGEINYKLSFGLLGTPPETKKPEDGTRSLGPNPDFKDRWPGPSPKKKDKLGLLDDKGGFLPARFDPGTNKMKATQTAFSFNVDGRVLAQTVIEQMEYLTEHATGAPAYNGQSHFARADSGAALV